MKFVLDSCAYVIGMLALAAILFGITTYMISYGHDWSYPDAQAYWYFVIMIGVIDGSRGIWRATKPSIIRGLRASLPEETEEDRRERQRKNMTV